MLCLQLSCVWESHFHGYVEQSAVLLIILYWLHLPSNTCSLEPFGSDIGRNSPVCKIGPFESDIGPNSHLTIGIQPNYICLSRREVQMHLGQILVDVILLESHFHGCLNNTQFYCIVVQCLQFRCVWVRYWSSFSHRNLTFTAMLNNPQFNSLCLPSNTCGWDAFGSDILVLVLLYPLESLFRAYVKQRCVWVRYWS